MQYAWMTVLNWSPKEEAAQLCPEDIILTKKDIEKFCDDFGLRFSDIDLNHGILRLTLPPDAPKFSVMINAEKIEDLQKNYPGNFDGPWSDYKIGPASSAPDIGCMPDPRQPKPKPPSP